jgi:hypothetical protein
MRALTSPRIVRTPRTTDLRANDPRIIDPSRIKDSQAQSVMISKPVCLASASRSLSRAWISTIPSVGQKSA